MSDVFISYSRLDKEFVGQLRDALTRRAQDVWIDWEDIPPSQSWWNEIQKGIAKANNFVLVMSPNSLSSPICHMEIEHARQLKKRIIPVLHADYVRDECLAKITKRLENVQETTTREIWGTRHSEDVFDANDSDLKHINYFFFKDDADFETRLEDLFTIIRTDYEHKEQHTTLLLRAREWDRRGRDASFLLIDNELAQAQAWLTRSAGKEPPPTDLHQAYIQASEQRTRQLHLIQRASIVGSVVAVLALIFAVGASMIGLQATRSANTASTQVASANEKLATATHISEQAVQAQATLGAVNTQVSYAMATATDTAKMEEITGAFADAMLDHDDPRAQLEIMDDIVARYPNDINVYHLRGTVYDEQGDPEAAIEDYNRALRINPNLPDTYYNRAISYESLEEYDKALADYNEVLRLDPDYIDAYRNRAIIYFDQGNYDAAIADLTRVIEMAPDNPTGYYSRGIVAAGQDDYQAALADFNEAIRLDPDYLEAYYNRGFLYGTHSNYNLALADYNEVLRLDPDDADGYEKRGLLYAELSEYELAIDDFTQVIRLEPEDSGGYYKRALAYNHLGETEKAIDDFTQVIHLEPESPDAYNDRAYAYFALGDLEQAIADVTTAIELRPTEAYLYDTRCEFYLRSEQWALGVANCDKARALDAEWSFSREMQALLAEARQNIASPTEEASS